MEILQIWSWVFLAIYVMVMLILGHLGMRRVKGADDFATARGSYGAFFLALAFTSTVASGATFLGIPGLAYSYGLPVLWYIVGYPMAVYLGVWLCHKLVGSSGMRLGSRSIPEYLGDRFQSPGLRIIAAFFTLILLVYLAGQMVAGIVMFEMMLGLSSSWALGITTIVLFIYLVLGGAHADLLTDGIQGFLMLLLALAITILFLLGVGADGAVGEVIKRLREQDIEMVAALHRSNSMFGSAWAVVAIFVAHIPLGLMPHVANKLWALKDEQSRNRFILLALIFGIVLPAIGLGGLLARAVLGDVFIGQDGAANAALPALFIELMPAWLAALLGIGILAAVMSTADGLVIATSQVFANDLYRRSYAPRWHSDLDEQAVDRNALVISRWTTLVAMFLAATIAWISLDRNIALLTWIAIGGMTAALAGPMILGAVWRGVTRQGALWGFICGAGTFIVAHTGVVSADWFTGTFLLGPSEWFVKQAPNPFACATIADVVSVSVTFIVSKVSQPLPEQHVISIFETSD